MENNLILELGAEVKAGKKTWQEQTDLFNKKTNNNLGKEAFRKRYIRAIKKEYNVETNGEYETIYADGTIEAQVIVNLSPEEKKNANAILKKLGYNSNEWELVKLTCSNWQQHTKEQITKQLYAVKFIVKPKIKSNISIEESIEIANELIKDGIKPLKAEKKKENKELDNNKLLECPPIELHLGELSCWIDTGENYDQKIAQERFKEIISELVSKQEKEQCGTLLISVGGDFFNSDTQLNTTTKGTQQFNDVRWRKLYLIGLKLWLEALELLKDKFNKIDIQLITGNHDLQTSFYLYSGLQQAFKNYNNINFKEDYKEVQAYKFGECLILTTHGTRNVNKTMDSVVNEFSEEYGSTKYRELHLGHLHCEQELKERLGIIPRRLSSPKGRGDWEYNERFGSSIQKHELFIWEANKGLIDITMIPFEPEIEDSKKKVLKRK